MLNFAVQTAREAGAILAERFGRQNRIMQKGEIDIVTEADLAAEKFIIDRIKSQYPRHAILSEEAGAIAQTTGDAEWQWIIDPLDGTTNYAHGYPCFCVSVALERRGEGVVVGAVYDPIRDEMFAAERGQGATLNARRVRVSEVDDLNRALICTGFPYNVRDKEDFARHFIKFIMNSQAVRRDGSAALDLAYVACGRFDGFWEEGLRPWDVAAGALLIEEAGGRATQFDGSPYNIYAPPFLGSNGLVHDAMMDVFSK